MCMETHYMQLAFSVFDLILCHSCTTLVYILFLKMPCHMTEFLHVLSIQYCPVSKALHKRYGTPVTILILLRLASLKNIWHVSIKVLVLL